MANEAHITLPALTCSAEGTVPCREEHLTLRTELTRFAVTQYTHFNFNSFCTLGNVCIGANDLGIFTLFSGDTYDNIHIHGAFTLITSDFGSVNQKRIRELYFGYEASGLLTCTLVADESDEKTYTITPEKQTQKQHGGRIRMRRMNKGRYWSIAVENVNGCDFSIDQIDAVIIIEEKKV